MLTKINEIKNVGQFEEFLPSKVFDKNTVVFGFNGAGKSTLSDIFYSLSIKGKESLVTNRRTLNKDTDSEGLVKPISVEIIEEGGSVLSFDGSTWNQQPENLFVFNEHYIKEHVFVSQHLEGDTATIGMGHDGARLLRQKDALLEQRRVLLEKLSEDTSNLAQAGLKIKDFSTPKITEKTKEKRFESMSSFELFADSERLQIEERIRQNTRYVSAVGKIEECRELYSKIMSVEPIDKKVLLRTVVRTPRVSVKEIAAFLEETLTTNDISWAVAGYKNQKDRQICPLCGQKISDERAVELFRKLGKFVSQGKGDNIKAFSKQLNSLGNSIETLNLNEKVSVFVEIINILSDNGLLRRKDSARLQKGLSWGEEDRRILEEIVSKTLAKAENPFMDYSMTEEEKNCINLANGVIQNIKILGSIIDEASDRLLAKIDKEISSEEMSQRFTLSYGPLRNSAELIKENAKAYLINERKIQQLNSEIDDCYNQSRLAVVNDFLKRLNTHIRIEVSKNRYYARLKNFRRQEHSSESKLFSEGEQRAVAFAYFLAEIGDASIPEKIVVIDDPISSMDLSRKSIISHQVASMMNCAEWQVILMTHDISFVERVECFLESNVSCTKLELRGGKPDFLDLVINDYLTDDTHVYEELIHDAEVNADDITRTIALMSLRPYAFVKKVSDMDYREIEKRSTYFSHTLYSKNGRCSYRSSDYSTEKLKEYVSLVAAKTGTVIDTERLVGDMSFDGFDFESVSDMYQRIPLDSMKNARKKALLMRPLIEACFFQMSTKSKFDPEHIGTMYKSAIRSNSQSPDRKEICEKLEELYDSSKKYHHGADDGSLLGISWVNPNEIEYYDEVLLDIISSIRSFGEIRTVVA